MGERSVHTGKVTGSIPVRTTICSSASLGGLASKTRALEAVSGVVREVLRFSVCSAFPVGGSQGVLTAAKALRWKKTKMVVLDRLYAADLVLTAS